VQQVVLNDVDRTRSYIEALVRTGKKSRAEKEFESLLKSHPGDAERLREWWKGL